MTVCTEKTHSQRVHDYRRTVLWCITQSKRADSFPGWSHGNQRMKRLFWKASMQWIGNLLSFPQQQNGPWQTSRQENSQIVLHSALCKLQNSKRLKILCRSCLLWHTILFLPTAQTRGTLSHQKNESYKIFANEISYLSTPSGACPDKNRHWVIQL